MLDFVSRANLAPLAEALAPLARQASAHGLEWILFGAQARDLVLEVAGLQVTGRTTLDVDVAVAVINWQEYDCLRTALVQVEGATIDKGVEHRLRFANSSILDIIPFGGIEVRGSITWPHQSDVALRVLGLTEAKQTATAVTLPGPLKILIPSLPMYTSLKLLAWDSRHSDGIVRDATDLAGILSTIDMLIHLDELYSNHAPVMESCDFDSAFACAHILGERMAGELTKPCRTILRNTLIREADPAGPLVLARQLQLGPNGQPLLQALSKGFQAQSRLLDDR
jgi:predicted nucleotidyltransferase